MDSRGVAVLLHCPVYILLCTYVELVVSIHVPVPHQTVVEYERVVVVQYLVLTGFSDHVDVHWGRRAPPTSWGLVWRKWLS